MQLIFEDANDLSSQRFGSMKAMGDEAEVMRGKFFTRRLSEIATNNNQIPSIGNFDKENINQPPFIGK